MLSNNPKSGFWIPVRPIVQQPFRVGLDGQTGRKAAHSGFVRARARDRGTPPI